MLSVWKTAPELLNFFLVKSSNRRRVQKIPIAGKVNSQGQPLVQPSGSQLGSHYFHPALASLSPFGEAGWRPSGCTRSSCHRYVSAAGRIPYSAYRKQCLEHSFVSELFSLSRASISVQKYLDSQVLSPVLSLAKLTETLKSVVRR